MASSVFYHLNDTYFVNALNCRDACDGILGGSGRNVKHRVGVLAFGFVGHVLNVEPFIRNSRGDLGQDRGNVLVQYANTLKAKSNKLRAVLGGNVQAGEKS